MSLEESGDSSYGLVKVGAADPVHSCLERPELWILSLISEPELIALYARLEARTVIDVSEWVDAYGPGNRSLALLHMKRRIIQLVEQAQLQRGAGGAQPCPE